MKMMTKLMRMIGEVKAVRMKGKEMTLTLQKTLIEEESLEMKSAISYDDDGGSISDYRMGVDRADCLMNSCWRGSCRDIPG